MTAHLLNPTSRATYTGRSATGRVSMNMGQLAGFRHWGYDNRGWAQTTQYRYSTTCRNVDGWLATERDLGLLEADTDDLQAWMSTRPRNAGTRNGYRNALIAYFDWAMDVSLRQTNPAEPLPRLRVPKHLPKALHADDARLVLDQSHRHGPRWAAVVYLMFFGGLRAAEVIGAQWGDMRGDMLHVRGKGSKDRVVPLAAECMDVVEDWRAVSPPSDWMFPSPRYEGRHQSYNWTYEQVRCVASQAGVPGFHPHKGRHTAATSLLDARATVRDLQAFLGHSSLENTAKYLAVRPVAVATAVARMAY